MGNHLRAATIPPVPDLRFGSWKKPAKRVLASALGKESSRRRPGSSRGTLSQSSPRRAWSRAQTWFLDSPGPPEGLRASLSRGSI